MMGKHFEAGSREPGRLYWLVALLLVSLLAGCAGGGGSKSGGGRYSMDQDAYPDSPKDVANVPDAVPKVEPRSRSGNRSTYSVWGKTYHVLDDPTGYVAEGRASWYGVKFQGYDTANGDTYDMYKMSAAHRSLPLPTYARVTNLDNGREVIVRVNDRGPFHSDRLIDLSYAAAARLDILKGGTGRVRVEAIDPVVWARTHGQAGSTATRVAQNRASPTLNRSPSRPGATGGGRAAVVDYEASIDPVLAAASERSAASATGRSAVSSPAAPAPTTPSATTFSAPSTPVARSRPSTATASASAAGQRYLQVAALGSQAGAQALKSRLQGLLSQPVRIDNASPLYRVQVGPIEDLASLDSIRATLRNAGYGQTFLVAPTQ